MRVLQRTVQQIVDPVSWVPLLHDVEPQMEEQLVEVPTILTPFLRILQNVDTPVPHGGRGASGGLQGFLPGHI